jgi:hypothetical protein
LLDDQLVDFCGVFIGRIPLFSDQHPILVCARSIRLNSHLGIVIKWEVLYKKNHGFSLLNPSFIGWIPIHIELVETETRRAGKTDRVQQSVRSVRRVKGSAAPQWAIGLSQIWWWLEHGWILGIMDYSRLMDFNGF